MNHGLRVHVLMAQEIIAADLRQTLIAPPAPLIRIAILVSILLLAVQDPHHVGLMTIVMGSLLLALMVKLEQWCATNNSFNKQDTAKLQVVTKTVLNY